MTIYKEKLMGHIKSNVTIYLFMTSLLVTGVVFGAIIVNSMSFIQKQDLFFHMNQFFTKIVEQEAVLSKDMLQKSFIFHLQYLSIMLLLGLTIIGLPILWLLIFLKGLAIGFSVGFIVNQLGWKGFILATLSILPHNMMMIPIYIAVASLASLFSLLLFYKITAKKVTIPIGRPFVNYIFAVSLLILCSFLGSLIETFIAYEAVKIAVDSLLSN